MSTFSEEICNDRLLHILKLYYDYISSKSVTQEFQCDFQDEVERLYFKSRVQSLSPLEILNEIVTLQEKKIAHQQECLYRKSFFQNVRNLAKSLGTDPIHVIAAELDSLIDRCNFRENIESCILFYRNCLSGHGNPLDTENFARYSNSRHSEATSNGIDFSAFSRGFLCGSGDDINFYNISMDTIRVKELILQYYFGSYDDLSLFFQEQSTFLTKLRQALYSMFETGERIPETQCFQPLFVLFLNILMSKLHERRKISDNTNADLNLDPIRVVDARSLKMKIKLQLRCASKVFSKTKPLEKVISLEEVELKGFTDALMIPAEVIADPHTSSDEQLALALCHLEFKAPFDPLQWLAGNQEKNQLLIQTLARAKMKDRLLNASTSPDRPTETSVRGILTDGFVFFFMIKFDSNHYGITHSVLEGEVSILYLILASLPLPEDVTREFFHASIEAKDTSYEVDAMELYESDSDIDEDTLPKKVNVKRKIHLYDNSPNKAPRREEDDDLTPGPGGYGPAISLLVSSAPRVNITATSTSGATKISSATTSTSSSSTTLNCCDKENCVNSSSQDVLKQGKKKIVVNFKAGDDQNDRDWDPSFNSWKLALQTQTMQKYNIMKTIE